MDRSICYSDIINTYCEGKWKERNRGIFYLPEIANIAESNFAFHNKTRRSSLSVATYCNNARTDLASMMKCIMQLKYQIYKYTNIQRVFPCGLNWRNNHIPGIAGEFFSRVYISCKHCSLFCAPSSPVVEVTRVCALRKSTRSKLRLSCWKKNRILLIFISKKGFIFN